MSHSSKPLQFLDTLVYKDDQGLSTDVKPMDCNNLLEFDSHHSCSTVGSLPYSQLLRVKRIVQDIKLLEERLDDVS